jgi:hypothetical protein
MPILIAVLHYPNVVGIQGSAGCPGGEQAAARAGATAAVQAPPQPEGFPGGRVRKLFLYIFQDFMYFMYLLKPLRGLPTVLWHPKCQPTHELTELA